MTTKERQAIKEALEKYGKVQLPYIQRKFKYDYQTAWDLLKEYHDKFMVRR